LQNESRLRRKVAAHASTAEGIFNAVMAGVDSIEHGHAADRKDLELMKEKGVFLVPTVGGVDANYARRSPTFTPEERKSWDGYLQAIQESSSSPNRSA
jgi:imidazolonepropionase-like amidohydrolase